MSVNAKNMFEIFKNMFEIFKNMFEIFKNMFVFCFYMIEKLKNMFVFWWKLKRKRIIAAGELALFTMKFTLFIKKFEATDYNEF